MHPTSDEAARRRTRDLLVRSYLESALGLAGVFLVAAELAPWLFNVRNDAAVIAAVLLWICCPVLLFLLGSRVAGRWRRANQG